MPACRTDLLKELGKRGRACCNTTASRQTNGMDAYQIRTQSTDGANRKKFRGYSIVRSCCDTLKGMVLGFEGGFIWCTCRPNKTQRRNRLDLDITQSLNKTFGRSINFHHALHNVFWEQSNDEGNHQGQSLFQHICCMSRNSSQFSEIHVLKESCSSLPY